MIRRLINEDIELITLPAKDLGLVNVDPTQMEQVLVNLAVNARDAMLDGGRLVIKTANVVLDEEYAKQHPDAHSGRYVSLTVEDDGAGMTEETRAHIFDPFFTTKETGKGTGLGLSTCYGIISQNGGHINVESEPGRGATIEVFLPVVEGEAQIPNQHRQDYQEPPQGTETVLLVEDNDLVREVASISLRERGYNVIEAENGIDALNLARQHGKGTIDLVLTDIVMPEMGGRQLTEQIRQKWPTIKIIYMSGYTNDEISESGITETGAGFMQKPFTPAALAQKVREVLDR